MHRLLTLGLSTNTNLKITWTIQKGRPTDSILKLLLERHKFPVDFPVMDILADAIFTISFYLANSSRVGACQHSLELSPNLLVSVGVPPGTPTHSCVTAASHSWSGKHSARCTAAGRHVQPIQGLKPFVFLASRLWASHKHFLRATLKIWRSGCFS